MKTSLPNNPELYQEITQSIDILKQGGIIIFPTETFWGMGCDATNPEAVDKLFKIKHSKEIELYTILLENSALLPSYIDNVPEITWDLIDAANTPLTLIFEGINRIAPNILSITNSIGFRIVYDTFSKLLIQRLRKPILFTAASSTSLPIPKNKREINEQILLQTDYIVNLSAEVLPIGHASSIIKLFENGRFEIIRK